MSIVEKCITDSRFAYLQPYLYNNDYALRCELATGEERAERNEAAKRRAREIYDILFPKGADAVIFNHWITDRTFDGDALEYFRPRDIIREAQLNTELLIEYQGKYRHRIVRDLPKYDDDLPSEDKYPTVRHRVVCYSDGKGFDVDKIIDIQTDPLRYTLSPEIGLVSFENECIFSIYDERGCDVVFTTWEKMNEFYDALEPYFLDYDRELMQKRRKEMTLDE